MVRIGNVVLENPLIMAPMAGLTNLPLRLMARRHGAAMVVTEMISAAGLSRNDPKTLTYLHSSPEERPLAVQIFGSDPAAMAESARIAESMGADMVDVNMGCPARKVLRGGAGGGLLREPELARDILLAVRRAITIPLTVKIRAGWSPAQPIARYLAKMAEEAGVDAVTLHPRYVTQKFTGQAQWDIIARVKESVAIPVIGNGDITTPDLALRIQKETGCDGIMIGRAAVGNPWLFREILDKSAGREVRRPSLAERKAVILEHFHLLCEWVGELRAARIMRGLLVKYTRGLPNSTHFRKQFTSIRDRQTMTSTVTDYFEALERPKERGGA